ncbi:MAG TPA: hypothetical protein VE985_09790 [Gaiellaceae bacterium]|nr:hypothetical protein [Gaiellaceae bacterium]
MFEFSRPDVTNEGWHTWPTGEVSQALVRASHSRRFLDVHAAAELAAAPDDVAVFRLAPVVRDLVESLLRNGEADELRESLVIYALSRVDWLQLAQSVVEGVAPEDELDRGQPLAACAS